MNTIKEPPSIPFDQFMALWPIGYHFKILHDGFEGTVIGHYCRLDGYYGVVGQQAGTNIVHVYGARFLKPTGVEH